MTLLGHLKRQLWIVAVALLAGAAPASGSTSIGRADMDGTGVNPAFIDPAGSASPSDIAVAGDSIYWIAGGAIARADLEGSNIELGFITGLGPVSGLTANDQYLYWGGSSIGRAKLDGTELVPNLMTPSGGADDVAASGQYLYWTSDVGIGRANLDGTGADPKFIDYGVNAGLPPAPVNGTYPPTQVAVNSVHAFWVYSTYDSGHATSDIGRANLDGSGFQRVASGNVFGRGDVYGPLGADDSCLFVRVSSGLSEEEIRSFGANGSGCSAPSWPTNGVGGLAVAGGHVYWAQVAEDKLFCRLDDTQRNQRLRGRKIRFEVWFEACERITVRASGRATVGGERYELKPVKIALGPTDPSLALRPTPHDRDPILDAIKDGRSARANIRLRIEDASGNSDTMSYVVRVTRR